MAIDQRILDDRGASHCGGRFARQENHGASVRLCQLREVPTDLQSQPSLWTHRRVRRGITRQKGSECARLDTVQSRIEADQGSSKAERRSALWSNVRVRAQPARAPSAPIRASANEPCPPFSATIAMKPSCSFSTTRTSVCRMRSTAAEISGEVKP